MTPVMRPTALRLFWMFNWEIKYCITDYETKRTKKRIGWRQKEQDRTAFPAESRVRTGPGNLESPGILLRHYLGLESPGKGLLNLESADTGEEIQGREGNGFVLTRKRHLTFGKV